MMQRNTTPGMMYPAVCAMLHATSGRDLMFGAGPCAYCGRNGNDIDGARRCLGCGAGPHERDRALYDTMARVEKMVRNRNRD